MEGMQGMFPGQFGMPGMNMPQERRVEIKAGKMIMDETMTVRPDKRRGKIIVEDLPGEGATHFKWSDINNSEPEEYIVFPGADRFCKVMLTEDRVYVLEYSGLMSFYWLLEEDKSKDAETIKRINEIMGNATFTGYPTPAGEAPIQPAGLAPTGSAEPLLDPNSAEALRRLQLLSILDLFASSVPPMGPPGPNLAEIFSAEELDAISNDETIQALTTEHLPEGQRDQAGFRANLLSPLFQQALLTLSAALRSEIGDAVLASFGLHNVQVSEVLDKVEKLIMAIDAKVKAENPEAAKPSEEAKKEDEAS